MLKFPTVLALALLVAACASSPPRTGSTPAAATPAVPNSAAGAAVTTSTAAAATSAKPTRHLMNGFTLVMKNGVATYCRDDVKTGSHIMVQRQCLSQRAYDSLEDDTRRDMDRVRNTINPNMGTTGGSSH